MSKMKLPDFSDKVITVFGGTGFLGKNLICALAKTGAQIQVPTRNPDNALALKPYGAVGQITGVPFNIHSDDQLSAIVKQSDIVINLIGILYEKGKNSFKALHHEFPRRLGEQAKAHNVKRLIHISAIGANSESTCQYQRTKGLGEYAIQTGFSETSILRPSIMFGPGDSFFNLFARMSLVSPFLPLIGGGKTKFQPVYVQDVVAAIMHCLATKNTGGNIYELGGPHVYSFKELLQITMRETHRDRAFMPLPMGLAKFKAFFLQYLPKPPLTPDQVEALKSDNIVDKKALGFKDLGLEPVALEVIVPDYLVQYRPGGIFGKKAA